MKAKLVKFNDDGTECKRNIEYLRRHPECGIPFIQDKPFEPDDPKHKFKPIHRNFSINSINKVIPSEPSIPAPPQIGQPPKMGQAVGQSPYGREYLPQDYTNKYDVNGRRILSDTPHGHNVDEYVATKISNAFSKNGYGSVPRIGNDSYSHEPIERPSRPVGDVELQDFGAGIGNINKTPPPTLRNDRIRIGPDFRDTEFDLPQELNITDLPPDVKENILEILAGEGITETTRLEKVKRTLENTIDELNEQIQSSRRQGESLKLKSKRNLKLTTLKGVQNKLNKIINKKKLQRKLLEGQPDKLKPRGMTDEESLDAHIEQITRNSTQEEAKMIESQIKEQARRTRLPKKRVPFPEIEGTELVAIEPEKEEELILREAERFTRKGRPQISQREAEGIADKFLEKGISRSRTLQILEEYGLYDTQGEFELSQIADPRERAMIRRMRAQRIIEAERRDTNLLPERLEDIELREDTPLTRGRTDIARGRGRVEKAYDKIAGKLPEELRTLGGSIKRNTQSFNENIRTRSLEAIQSIKATSTRIFGQKYTSIRQTAGEVRGLQEIGTELGTVIDAPEGNINIRQPVTEDITGFRPNELQALDFAPLSAAYGESFNTSRPNLTYAQRMRAGAYTREAGIGSVGAAGGVLIGYGIAELMQRAGVHNKYAIAAGSGAGAGMGARILTMSSTSATVATEAAVESATYAAIRSGTSILRGGVEGGLIGLALMPLDMVLNKAFYKSMRSHIGANLASGTIVGGLGVGATTIGLASLGAAPETLGASLVIGAVAMGVTSIIGAVTGADQDRKEREAKRETKRLQDKINSTARVRQELLATLPNYNYDFAKALHAFPDEDIKKLGDGASFDIFNRNARYMFNPRPHNEPPETPTSGEPSGEQKRLDDLFSKYITHQLINRVCSNGNDCKEMRTRDQGELTNREIDFLNDKTSSTWQAQADMQVEMSVQELNYTRQRISDAQAEMLNAWNNEGKVANELNSYVVQTAELDENFRERYNLALKLDAQQQIVDAYNRDQTKMEQMPRNVRNMANLDPDFDSMIHSYYNAIETTSEQLGLSIPQLIELQGLEGEAQRDKYEEFQFDIIKQDESVVDEAQEIAREEDLVRAAEFYDIDEAYMLSDPTNITNWKPSDAQILQAYNAGMTLKEYTDYMHELAKGEAGNFSNLPKYTQEQINQFTNDDVAQFKAELKMSGHDGLYTWDSQNRKWILHDEVGNSAIASQSSLNRYTPRYLLQARNEYADMIHGLNETNQNEVDNFNANLLKELSSYGKHYDSIVADINNERLYEGRSDLLYYDIGKIYNENKIEFQPISDKLSDAPAVSQDIATGRQLEQASPNTETGVSLTITGTGEDIAMSQTISSPAENSSPVVATTV